MTKKELFSNLTIQYELLQKEFTSFNNKINNGFFIKQNEISELKEKLDSLIDKQNELLDTLKLDEHELRLRKDLELIVKKNSIDEIKEYLLLRLSHLSSLEYASIINEVKTKIESLDDSKESIEIAYGYKQLFDLYDKEQNKVNVLTKTFNIVNYIHPDFLLKLCYGLIQEDNHVLDSTSKKEEPNQSNKTKEQEKEVDCDMLEVLKCFEEESYQDLYKIVLKHNFNLKSTIIKEGIEQGTKKPIKFNKNVFLESKNNSLDKNYSMVLFHLYSNGFILFDKVSDLKNKQVIASLFSKGYLARINHEKYGLVYFLTEAGSKIYELYPIQKLIEKNEKVKIIYGKADLEILYSLIDQEVIEEACEDIKFSLDFLEPKHICYKTMPSARKSLVMTRENNQNDYFCFVGEGAFSFISYIKVLVDNKDAFDGNMIIISKKSDFARRVCDITKEYLGDQKCAFYYTTYNEYENYLTLDNERVSFTELMSSVINKSEEKNTEDNKKMDVETIHEEVTKKTDEDSTQEVILKDEDIDDNIKDNIIDNQSTNIDIHNTDINIDYENLIQSKDASSDIAFAMLYNQYFSVDVNQHLLNTLILENRFDCGALLLRCLQEKDETFKSEYSLLLCATGKSGDNYDGSLLNNYFTDISGNMDDYQMSCFVSTLLRILFRPAMVHDYKITGWYENFKNMNSDLAYFSILKKIAKRLRDTLDTDIAGFSKNVISKFRKKKDYKYTLVKIREKARGFMQKKAFTFADHGLFSKCIGDKSEIYKALTYVLTDKSTELDYIKSVILKYKDNNDFMDSRITTDLRQNNSTLRNNKATLKPVNEKEIIREYKARLDLLLDYVDLVEEKNEGISDTLSNAKEDLIALIHEYQSDFQPSIENNIINQTLMFMLNELDGVEENNKDIKEYLLTENIMLDEFLKIDERACPYFSLYDRTLKHISEYEEPENFLESLKENLNNELTNENVGLIDKARIYLENNSTKVDFDFDLCEDYKESIMKQSKELILKIHNLIDLDSMYGRIDESDTEILYGELEAIRTYFDGSFNLGVLKTCLQNLKKSLKRKIALKKQLYLDKYASYKRIEEIKEYPILDLIHEAIEEENFTVADEYIALLNNGSKELGSTSTYLTPYFGEFINLYDRIEEELSLVRGRPLKAKFDSLNLKLASIKAHSTLESIKNSSEESLLDFWPRNTDEFVSNPTCVKDILEALQFDCDELSEVKWVKNNPYVVASLRKVSKNHAEYFHPISVFGTAMQDNTPVVYLNGLFNAQDINNYMTKEFNYEGYSICLLDTALSLSERKKLAFFFKTSGTFLHRYLVLDRVLLSYLSLITKSERQQAFIKCTMPFTYHEPFIENGSGSINDEMFYGRSHELNSLIDINNGSTLVYGGRQLGKTALLHRVENLMMKPDQKSFTIYLELKNKKESGEVLDLVIQEMLRLSVKVGKSILISKQKAKTIHSWSDFATVIKNAYHRGDFFSLYLLFDEADEFVAEQGKNDYEAINQLISLKDDSVLKGRFKFVLAGLHNVLKFINNKENDSIRKLGAPLCIKPLSTLDAKRLIQEPLAAIGYSFSNPDQQLSMILSKLNYYPGLLHLFCAKIVQTTSHFYQDYFSKESSPPYVISDSLLGKLLTNTEINQEVTNKLTMTLDLNGSLYSKIACAISYRYEYDDKQDGLTIDEISEFFEEGYDKNKVKSLVEEMIELGVLSKSEARHDRKDKTNNKTKYFYRKYNFHKSLVTQKTEQELLEVALQNYEN